MSESAFQLPPLDGEVEAVLRCERERPTGRPAQADRMWSVIAAELAALPPLSSASHGTAGSATGVAPPAAAASAPIPIASGIVKLALLKALPWVVVSLGVGSGSFVAGQHIARRTAARSVKAATEVPAALGAGQAPVAPPGAEVVKPAPNIESPPVDSTPRPALIRQGSVAAPRTKHNALEARSDSLEDEESMLRYAESELKGGDWGGALAQTDAYARRYPRGQLAEEAALLGIRACIRGGDRAAASSRLAEFRKRFPASPLGKSLGD